MREAKQSISPQDGMYDPAWPNAYRYWGRSAIRCIHHALDLTGVEPARILDLPSGHGRVLRWLAAEFPQATITACDLDRDGVDFCAREFGAIPIYSSEAPEQIPLERYDLIWIGSLFTHLDAPLWPRFLSALAEHLDGVMLFTTAGEYVAELMREGEDHGVDNANLLGSYDRTGFGYADYPGQAYGLARAKPDWVLELLGRLPLEVVEVTARGWAKRQDVYTVRPR
jgi:SAM-dependent methyltransferase